MTSGLSRLSEREREVLRLLNGPHDIKSIARSLGISPSAVNERLREARRKLGVSSSREAARLLAAEEQAAYNKHVDSFPGIAPGPATTPDGSGGAARRKRAGGLLMFVLGGMAMLAFVASAALFFGSEDRAAERPVVSLPVPAVIGTSPRAGSTIAPGPFTLSVTFDQPMAPGSYSFVRRSAETYPHCAGRPALSRDGRTYSLRCTGLPGRSYEVWFNRPPYLNFKSLAGAPAQPYRLSFRTRSR